jgi:hypothetical protein
MSNAQSLKFETIINGIKKRAVTHFRTEYTVEKTNGSWGVKVTVPPTRGIGGGTETLVKDVSYAKAIKAANDDYKRNGGR